MQSEHFPPCLPRIAKDREVEAGLNARKPFKVCRQSGIRSRGTRCPTGTGSRDKEIRSEDRKRKILRFSRSCKVYWLTLP